MAEPISVGGMLRPPGDPAKIAAAARGFTTTGQAVTGLDGQRQSMTSTVLGSWVGGASDGFDRDSGELGTYLVTIADFASDIEGPVVAYSERLRTEQANFDAAAARYNAANDAVGRADAAGEAAPEGSQAAHQAEADGRAASADRYQAQVDMQRAYDAALEANEAAAKAVTDLAGMEGVDWKGLGDAIKYGGQATSVVQRMSDLELSRNQTAASAAHKGFFKTMGYLFKGAGIEAARRDAIAQNEQNNLMTPSGARANAMDKLVPSTAVGEMLGAAGPKKLDKIPGADIGWGKVTDVVVKDPYDGVYDGAYDAGMPHNYEASPTNPYAVPGHTRNHYDLPDALPIVDPNTGIAAPGETVTTDDAVVAPNPHVYGPQPLPSGGPSN